MRASAARGLTMPSEPHVRVFADPKHLFHGGAEIFCDIGRRAIQHKGRFTIALAGGSTPRGLHQELTTDFRSQLDWPNAFFFFGDERHVPPTDQESNYRMAKETLFLQLDISPDHVFRIPAEIPDAGEAAQAYQHTLREFFQVTTSSFPHLDLVLLGMGLDGHTASLFPGTTALEERHHWVVANWVERFSVFRITFTYPLLNNAENVLFLVSGGEKAEMVLRALKDPSANLPCQGVQPISGQLTWLLDQAAAAKL